MKKILVTGGAGYIGSHTLLRLDEAGYETVTIDDLSRGFKEAVIVGEFVNGRLGDGESLDKIFETHAIDAVIHFAAYSYVGESVTDPGLYYRRNVGESVELFEAMVKHDVKKIVFSSTCAVYGVPETVPMTEKFPHNPISPYGATKMMIERALADYEVAYGLSSVSLRYFNAAGADPKGRIGESHDPETHLIPLAVQAALGKRDPLTVFGNDYPTPDGTCIRDYIHIFDLADAHLAALDYLTADGESIALNLGVGHGYSVKDVIDSVERVSGKEVPHTFGDRRAGDPPELVADASLANKVLDWKPAFTDLDDIITSACRWHEKLPFGFASQ